MANDVITKEEAFAICDHMQKTLDIEEMIMLVHAYEKMKAIIEGETLKSMTEGKDAEVETIIERPRRGHGRIDPEEVRKLSKGGMSQKDIAAQLGCSAGYVSTVIKKIGLQDQKIDKGKVMALHKAGWAQKDIAGDLHCEEKEVANVLSEAGK